MVNLADEIEYIWTGRCSWIRWAYVFVRHFPYLAQISILALIADSLWGSSMHNPIQCRDLLIYELSVNEALTIIVEAVLIIRIYAMFNCDTRILTVVLILYVGEISAMVTVLAISIPRMEFTTGCIITYAPSVFTSYWMISLAFETILFGMTLIKFFVTVASDRSLRRSWIMYILVRDGTWAFAVIFTAMLMNTFMYHFMHNSLAGLFFLWELSVMSLAGSHVLLNLRRLAVQTNSFKDSQWTSDETNTTVQFTSRVTYPALYSTTAVRGSGVDDGNDDSGDSRDYSNGNHDIELQERPRNNIGS